MSNTVEKKHIAELHEENKTWVSDLTFYRDELKLLQRRLDEVARANTGKDVMVQVEQYQNKIIRQNEVVDTLMHNVKEHESYIQKTIMDNPTASDHKLMNDHPSLRDQMKQFVKLYDEMKHDLYRFLSTAL
jgi:hypothetical protein